MERRFHARSLYHRTGCLLHPSYPFCKILWLRKHQADLFKRTAKFLSIKSFILATLFPGYVEDISVASATGLLNVRSLLWDGEALALTGLSQRRLPEVVSPYERVGQLGPERAKELGLPVGTPVIAGAGDGPLANVGGGSLRPEVVHVTVGTSAAVRAATKRPIFDSKQRLWCYRLDEDYFIFGGSSNVGAYIRQWARDRFGFEGLDQEMDMAIIRRLNSPKPLLFYPFLRGERSPHWEARLRGGLLGFSSRHDRCDFIKAAVEGVGFNLLSILDALQECLGRAGDTVCAGGGLKSKALAQILAAVFNSKIRIPKELEASARGACIVGLKAIGAIKGLTEAEDTRDFYREVTPDPERVKLYKKLFGLYRSYFPFIQSLSLELDRIEI